MREYNYALWCVKKHLLLSDVHTTETIQKLIREIDRAPSKATRIEAEYALKNFIAAEEHLVDEIIPQIEDPEMKVKLSEIADKIRALRQELANTGLPFRSDVPVDLNVLDVLDKIKSETSEILEKIDEYAIHMKQEQIECERCVEDLEKLKKAITTGCVICDEIKKNVCEPLPPDKKEMCEIIIVKLATSDLKPSEVDKYIKDLERMGVLDRLVEEVLEVGELLGKKQ